MDDTPSEDAARVALHADAEEFLDKWRGRWPEWRIAQTFVDADQRARAEAWFALLQELIDAAWSSGDPTPGIAKLGWWQDELRGWAKGARRHPLGIDLQKTPAPWPSLAAALTALQASREAVIDGDAAVVAALAETLRPCAEAIEDCECALFGETAVEPSIAGSTAQNSAHRHATTGRAFTEHTASGAGVVLIGLHALWASAETPDAARHAERARALLAVWPRPATMRSRRVYDALIRARLRTIAAGHRLTPLSPWATLWAGWRAARR